MWQNVISIDKSFEKEYEYILKGLSFTGDNMSFVVRESKNRYFIHVLSNDIYARESQEKIVNIIETVLLVFIKYAYIAEKVDLKDLSITSSLLISAVLCFDYERESAYVRKTLSGSKDYSIDALLNFRLDKLLEGWEELREIAANIIGIDKSDAIDLFQVIKAGMDRKCHKLFVSSVGDSVLVTNATKGRLSEIIDLYSDPEFNILFTVVRENPQEIVLDCKAVPKRLETVFNENFKVKYI